MLVHLQAFVVVVFCAIAARALAAGFPADVHVRTMGATILTVALVVVEVAAPGLLGDAPTLFSGIAMLAVALVAGLAWRIPDRMQSWTTEAGELALLVVAVVAPAVFDGAGTTAASILCVAWAVGGVRVGRRTSPMSSQQAVGPVLVLGVTVASLALHGQCPASGPVVALLSTAVALTLDRATHLAVVGRRVLLATLGGGAVMVATWLVGLPLDGRALLPALVGAFLVDARARPVRAPAPPQPPEAFDAERETLIVLGRLADPLGASTKHVMFSLEHLFPGGRIELLRNPQGPAATQDRGARINPELLAEVCRRGVLRSDTLDVVSRPVAAALRRLGPNVVLLPVTYEAHVYGALLVRGAHRFEGSLAPARRFADLLGHRLETQRLFAELQHKQRLALLGTFAAALMHDMRSPLATVRLNMQLLQRAMSHTEQAAFTDAIRALDRVLDELSGTLDFTRPLELDMSTLDLGDLVEEVVRSHQSQAERQEVTLASSTATSGPVRVRGDRARLLRVLENLLRNALEVSSSGSTVSIALCSGTEGTEVTVSDQGPGIEPCLAERVFEPFVTTKREGVGLGLAVVRKTIEAHNGRVTLKSAPNRGANFTVWLPNAHN